LVSFNFYVWVYFTKVTDEYCDIITERNVRAGYNRVTKENKEDLNMAAIKINRNNFREEVLNSDRPVLLDFWASWCGPCRMVGPILDEISEEREDIKVCKINVDEEPELASEYKIMSIPSLMVIMDGKIVNQSVGAKPKAQILAML
jgi:thioredoxin 1